MSLILHYAPQTRAVNILWALEELGVPYEKVKVDLSKGEQRTLDYKKLNPNGKVPTLIVDGHPMFETLAILFLLAERYGVTRNLWPAADTTARLDAMSWSSWGTSTLGVDLFRFVHSSSEMIPKERHNAAAAAAARADIEAHLAILDERLEGRMYVLGDEFSIADMAVSSATAFATRIGIDLTAFPRVKTWLALVRGRPALARAEQM